MGCSAFPLALEHGNFEAGLWQVPASQWAFRKTWALPATLWLVCGCGLKYWPCSQPVGMWRFKQSLISYIVFAFWKGMPEWNWARQQRAYRDKMTSGDRRCHPDKRAFTPLLSCTLHCVKHPVPKGGPQPQNWFTIDMPWPQVVASSGPPIYLVPKAVLSHSQPPRVLASSQPCPSGQLSAGNSLKLGCSSGPVSSIAFVVSIPNHTHKKKSLFY